MKYDVITFGSGAMDIYVKSEKFLPVSDKCFFAGKGIHLPFGSKMEVEDVFTASGGGGTNAAATFAKQGFKVAWCGGVGDDVFGNLLMKDLKKYKINSSLVVKKNAKLTNTSILLVCPGKDRTVLVYRGASDCLSKKDISWTKIKSAKWFYLAPFSGKLAELTDDLIDFAKKNKIKVAFNPGYGQLIMAKPLLEKILENVDVLILNREEAALLAGGKKVFKKLNELTKGIIIITKGADGVDVSDGKYFYKADSLKLEKVDPNGAGDSFGAGFVSGLMQKGEVEYGIQLAMANSGYNITKWGAKEGLLKKSQKFEKVKVAKKQI